MKKFSEWFMRQTTPAKIALVAAFVILVIAGIYQLSIATAPEPKPEPTPTPTQEPVTPTPTPEPTIEEPPIFEESDSHGDTVFGSDETAQEIAAMMRVAEEGALAQCYYDYRESVETRVARIAPYFKNPESVIANNPGFNPTDAIAQNCIYLGFQPTNYNANTRIFTLNITVNQIYVPVGQDTSGPEMTTQSRTINYYYDLEQQPDGRYLIVGQG